MRNYFEAKESLRDLLSDSTQIFMMDWALKGGKDFRKVLLRDIPEDYFPSSEAFFDSEFATDAANELAAEKGSDYYINIDGEWYLEDWSEVPRLYKQIYAFNHAMRNIREPSIASRVRPSLTHLPFRGGYSIVHMLDSMHDAIPPISRVKVESIVYQSPGHIGLRVDQIVAQEIEDVMSRFSTVEGIEKIHESYKRCRKFLVEEGLGTLSADEFNRDLYKDFDDVVEMIKERLADLLTDIGYAADIPFLVTDEAPLPMLKTILAYVKRLMQLNEYVEEGLISKFGGAPKIK